MITGAGNIQDKYEASYSIRKARKPSKIKANSPIHNDDCMSRGYGSQLKETPVAKPGAI